MEIKFNNLSFTYNKDSIFKVDALKNVNLTLNNDKITAIVGRTGSGKSTLTELINVFIRPTFGEVNINGFKNTTKGRIKHKAIQSLRKDNGFLFQFSENQLFEESVIKDVMFGIRNFYPKDIDIEEKAKDALNLVGLDESFYNRSPFDLSGGEKKRVAIAGVIAYKPKLLILDEPTAGLDYQGKIEIMNLFKKIHETGVGIILVTHDMDIVYKYADRVVVIDDGEIKKEGTPIEVLSKNVEQYNLETPSIVKAINLLNDRGFNIPNNIDNIDDLVKEIKHHG